MQIAARTTSAAKASTTMTRWRRRPLLFSPKTYTFIVVASATALSLVLIRRSVLSSTLEFPRQPQDSMTTPLVIGEEEMIIITMMNQTVAQTTTTTLATTEAMRSINNLTEATTTTTSIIEKDLLRLQPDSQSNDTTTNNNTNNNTLHYFTGSTVRNISPGMLAYENVCLVQNDTSFVDRNGDPRVSRTMKLRSFASSSSNSSTDDDDDGRLHASLPSDFSERNYRFLFDTEGGSWQEWQTTSSQVLIEDETLLTMQLFRNPGHCLSDMVFSLAYDRVARLDDQHPRKNHNAPLYRRFVYGTWREVRTSPYQPDWCFEVMRAAGYIDPDRTMITTKASDGTGSVCFRRLLVPILGLYRFPIETDGDNEHNEHNNNNNNNNNTHHKSHQKAMLDSFVQLSVMKQFRTRNYNNNNNNNNSDHRHDDKVYPQAALEALRRDMSRSLGLSMEPWPSTKDSNKAGEKLSMLFYDRKGSPRRHWINADEVKEQLEATFDVTIHQMGNEWDDLNATQQLTLYNNYSHIITVHGAHEANLIMARPHTGIIEIQCVRQHDPRPDYTLTEPNDDGDPVAWYGPMSWFPSFTRRLQMEHFLYSETDGCIVGSSNVGLHGADQIRVNVTQMVHFVATRFALSRKEEPKRIQKND